MLAYGPESARTLTVAAEAASRDGAPPSWAFITLAMLHIPPPIGLGKLGGRVRRPPSPTLASDLSFVPALVQAVDEGFDVLDRVTNEPTYPSTREVTAQSELTDKRRGDGHGLRDLLGSEEEATE